MTHNLLSLLPLINPALRSELVPDQPQERIEQLMAQLPLFAGGLLECPLGRAAQSVDLAVRATAVDGGFKLLEDSKWLAEKIDRHEGWQRIREFSRLRNSWQHKLRHAVHEAWLEFDLNNSDDLTEPPNFFFKLESYFGRPPLLGPQVAARLAETIEVISEGVNALGLKLDPARRDALERHIKHIPAAARLTYVGVMLPRRPAGYRLTIGHVPLSELTAYLKRIEWPQAREPIAGIINLLLDHVQHVVLHLDVAEHALSRIGFEVSFEKTVDQTAAWRRLFHALVSIGLCSPAQAEAAHDWPVYLHSGNFKNGWPQSLPRLSGYFARSINHIKLIYDPGPAPMMSGVTAPISIQSAVGALTAKVYLAFNYGSTIPRSILSRKEPESH